MPGSFQGVSDAPSPNGCDMGYERMYLRPPRTLQLSEAFVSASGTGSHAFLQDFRDRFLAVS
jgi:hypothetical protein